MMSSTMPSAKVVLLGIAAHVLKRQDRDRRLIGQRPARTAVGCVVLDRRVQRDRRAPAAQYSLGSARRYRRSSPSTLPCTCRQTSSEIAMPPGSAMLLHPRGDVDAVAENIVALDDDVADIDADAEFDAVGLRRPSACARAAASGSDRAGHRVHGAGEFDEHAVAHDLDDPPACSAILGRSARRMLFRPPASPPRRHP